MADAWFYARSKRSELHDSRQSIQGSKTRSIAHVDRNVRQCSGLTHCYFSTGSRYLLVTRDGSIDGARYDFANPSLLREGESRVESQGPPLDRSCRPDSLAHKIHNIFLQFWIDMTRRGLAYALIYARVYLRLISYSTRCTVNSNECTVKTGPHPCRPYLTESYLLKIPARWQMRHIWQIVNLYSGNPSHRAIRGVLSFEL